MSTTIAPPPTGIPLTNLSTRSTTSTAHRTLRQYSYVPAPIQSAIVQPSASSNAATVAASTTPASQSTTTQPVTVSNPNNIPTPNLSNVLALSQHTVTTLKGRWEEFWTAANGIAVAGLVLALAFGIGAWTGMNMQYNQGEKSLQLSIWATCADHEVRKVMPLNHYKRLPRFGFRAFKIPIYVEMCYPKVSINSSHEVSTHIKIV